MGLSLGNCISSTKSCHRTAFPLLLSAIVSRLRDHEELRGVADQFRALQVLSAFRGHFLLPCRNIVN